MTGALLPWNLVNRYNDPRQWFSHYLHFLRRKLRLRASDQLAKVRQLSGAAGCRLELLAPLLNSLLTHFLIEVSAECYEST